MRADRALRRSLTGGACWGAGTTGRPDQRRFWTTLRDTFRPATMKRRNLALGSSQTPRAELLGRHARNKRRSAPLNPLASAYQPPAAALVRLHVFGVGPLTTSSCLRRS